MPGPGATHISVLGLFSETMSYILDKWDPVPLFPNCTLGPQGHKLPLAWQRAGPPIRRPGAPCTLLEPFWTHPHPPTIDFSEPISPAYSISTTTEPCSSLSPSRHFPALTLAPQRLPLPQILNAPVPL